MFDDGSGPALYVGGDFTTAGGVAANHIAKWDGSSWSALGSGMDAASVRRPDGVRRRQRAGALRRRRLHDRGRRGGEPHREVGRLELVGARQRDERPFGDVHALAVFDDGGGPALYAGGDFTTAGGVAANRIAKWDGSSWSALGSGMNDDGPTP